MYSVVVKSAKFLRQWIYRVDVILGHCNTIFTLRVYRNKMVT